LIQTIKYQTPIQKIKTADGKEIPIKIPESKLLERMGALVQVTITHPRVVADVMKTQGKQIPAITVQALIDTGASSTVISPKVSSSLNLKRTGTQNVSSVQDDQERPVFFGSIIFPWRRGMEAQLVECPLRGNYFDCLIGRDVLQHWHFSYNGTDGSYVICD
jgi:predicted aspartyl protease